MNKPEAVFDYLNGHLSENERRDFETALMRDPELAEQMRSIREEMRFIRQSFERLDAPAFKGAAPSMPLAAKKRKSLFWPPLIAAAILIVGFLLYDKSDPIPALPGPIHQIRVVLGTDNPKINIYVVDVLPVDLWQGGEP